MTDQRRAFAIALVLWALSGLAALAVSASADEYPIGNLVRGAISGVVIAVVLWLFERRGHAWPWWVLGGLLILGVVSLLSYLDARALLAIGDALGIAVLVRGRPRP